MTETIFGNTPPDDLSLDGAGRLMRLGLGGGRRPIDRLVERLEAPDGADWLVSRLAAGPLVGLGSAAEVFAKDADLESLTRVKNRSKEIVTQAGSGEERLAGVAGYFLSIAAAYRSHGAVITSRRGDELAAMLLDLATVAPSPFTELLSEAAVGLDSSVPPAE